MDAGGLVAKRQKPQKRSHRKTFLKRHKKRIMELENEDYTQREILNMLGREWFANGDRTLTIAERLYKDCGLTKAFSKKLAIVIEPLQNTCYSDAQLFDIALEYAHGHYDSRFDKRKPFPFPDHPINTWITTSELTFCNLDTHIDNAESVVNALNAFDKYTLVYHTTSWTFGIDILKNGVDHEMGRKCLDFGLKPSFYSTEDLNTAIEWGRKKMKTWYGQVCIVVFAMAKTRDRNLRQKSFREASEEWSELVTQSRVCQTKKNELDKYDIVNGPMCANVHQVHMPGFRAIAHNNVKYQWASKTETADAYMNTCVIGVLFFER